MNIYACNQKSLTFDGEIERDCTVLHFHQKLFHAISYPGQVNNHFFIRLTLHVKSGLLPLYYRNWLLFGETLRFILLLTLPWSALGSKGSSQLLVFFLDFRRFTLLLVHSPLGSWAKICFWSRQLILYRKWSKLMYVYERTDISIVRSSAASKVNSTTFTPSRDNLSNCAG